MQQRAYKRHERTQDDMAGTATDPWRSSWHDVRHILSHSRARKLAVQGRHAAKESGRSTQNAPKDPTGEPISFRTRSEPALDKK